MIVLEAAQYSMLFCGCTYFLHTSQVLERSLTLHVCDLSTILTYYKLAVCPTTWRNKRMRVLQSTTMNIFTSINNFLVLKSNGIHPQILSNKTIIFSRNEEEK